MSRYSSRQAYDIIVSYTADGDETMAARKDGLRRRKARMTEHPDARDTTTINTGDAGDQQTS